VTRAWFNLQSPLSVRSLPLGPAVAETVYITDAVCLGLHPLSLTEDLQLPMHVLLSMWPSCGSRLTGQVSPLKVEEPRLRSFAIILEAPKVHCFQI